MLRHMHVDFRRFRKRLWPITVGQDIRLELVCSNGPTRGTAHVGLTLRSGEVVIHSVPSRLRLERTKWHCSADLAPVRCCSSEHGSG